MKSYCIKTNNDNIVSYLLDKIEKINYENIYYCYKKFVIYKNVIIHYVGDSTDNFKNFVSEIISDTIINFYEEKILLRIINSNYFYFDNFERNKILQNCEDLCKTEAISKKEILFKQIYEYLNENKSIVIDGIVNFRIKEYMKELDNIVDIAVNQYIIEKEYNEFINLLKAYVNTAKTGNDLVHLIYTNGESILLDEDKNIISLTDNIANAKYLSDISFSSNDYALNTLLSIVPKNIEIHLICDEDEFINTLKHIFEDRIYICRECNICKTYKMIQNVRGI